MRHTQLTCVCRQDNDIFQLARNINVGFFAAVVLRDYVAAILNTPRANSEWSLDLGKEIKQGGTRVERYVATTMKTTTCLEVIITCFGI